MQFLNGSEGKCGYLRPNPNPYGDEPWPCVNKLCEHYRIDGAVRISSFRIGNDVVAEFKCASCGMLYRRRKPEQSFDEYAKRPIIIEYGELFDSALRDCMEKRILGCEETSKIVGRPYGTVMKRARAIGIDVSIHYTASYSCQRRTRRILPQARFRGTRHYAGNIANGIIRADSRRLSVVYETRFSVVAGKTHKGNGEVFLGRMGTVHAGKADTRI